MKTLVAAIALAGAGAAFAADLPTGGSIVAGSGSITGSGNTLNVQQNSNKLIANWQSFDIGTGHTVNFLQPGAHAVALNRVLGNSSSQIYGSLNANGQVFLVNPNGVLFGQGASVNVGGLVASTLNISDSDFLSDRFVFSGKGRNAENASVINAGTITVADGGAVALLGGSVSNTGIIRARLGKVVLGAGNKLSLGFAGDGLLALKVDESALNALVENHGAIVADGGQVLLTAKATDVLLQTVVNNTGLIQAQTLQEKNGKIILMGGFEGGSTQVAGTLDASAPVSGNGGFIETSGTHVQIAAGTQVTTRAASGATGSWLVDPTDFTISSGSGVQTDSGIGATALANILSNTDVILATLADGAEAGDINVDASIFWGGYSLTLRAHKNININAAIINAGSGQLVLDAGGDVHASAAVVLGGNSTITAVGDIRMDNAGNDFVGTVSLSGQNVWLTDSNALNLAAVTAQGLVLNAGGTISATGAVDVGVFQLNAGSWLQNAASLPGFSATDFRLRGGTFLRVQGGDGSSASPYQISDVYGLQGINGFLGKSFVLVNDIDAAGTMAWQSHCNLGGWCTGWGGEAGFRPLGGGSTPFTGSFDGQGHSISNLFINFPAQDYMGLFGYAGSGSSISRVSLIDAVVTGQNWVGGLFGWLAGNGSELSVSATVSGITRVGGLGGENAGLLVDAEAAGSVMAAASNAYYLGGLVGANSGTLQRSSASSTVSGGSYTGTSYVGGLVGGNYSGIIEDSHATGDVSGTQSIGGLVGYGVEAYAGFRPIISRSYASGSVTGSSTVGGLAGYVFNGLIEDSYAEGAVIATNGIAGGLVASFSGDIERSYARGSVTAGQYDIDGKWISGGAGAGGLVGYMSSGSITESYSSSAVTGWSSVGGLVGKFNGALSNSYASGSVSGNGAVAGLLGVLSPAGVVTNSYASGAVLAATETSTGTMVAAQSVGGLIGVLPGGEGSVSITDSYWNTETSGQATSAGGSGKTTAQMQQAATFAGWDIDAAGGGSNIWRIYEGNTAPLLKAFLSTLNVAVSSDTLTYDGQFHGGTVSYSAQFPGLVLGNTQTPTYRNAGSYTLDLPGLYSTQRGYDIVTTGGTLTIDKATLSIAAVSDSKVYDGSTSSTQAVSHSGLVAGDTLTGLAQAFTSKNVQGSNGSTLVVNGGYVLNDGNGGGNYTVTVQDASGTITPRALVLGAVADTRVYDAGTTSSGSVTVSGLAAGDTVSNLSQSFDSRHAGNRTLAVDAGYIVNDGNNGANYSITQETAQGRISAAALLIAASSDSKDYDGNTSSSATLAITGLLGSDSVDDQEQVFASRNVLGSGGSTLTVSNYTVNDGNGGANYIVTTQEAAGTINAAALQIGISDVSKVYDGTLNVDAAAVTVQILSGTLKGSDTLGSGSYAFTDANAGSGKTVTVSGFTVDDGNFGGNYTLSYVNNSTSEITPAPLTIRANDQQIIYGGAPYAGGNGLSYAGFVNGETASVLSGAVVYGGSAQGAVEIGDYVITAGGLTSGNYNITFVDGNLNVSPPIFIVPGAPLAGHEAALTAQHPDMPLPAAPTDSFVIDVQADGIRLVAVPSVKAPALTPAADTAPAVVRAPLKEVLPPNGSLLFASNSPLLNEEEARKLLQALAERLKANPEEKVRLIGHTDSTGSERYNESLSARRAQAVARVLESMGVAPEQIVVTGDGFRNPLDNNRRKEGRARNRRVDFDLP